VVENIHMDHAGDDAVAIKAGKGPEAWNRQWTCEDVYVRNIKLVFGDDNGLCIGSDVSGGLRGIFAEGFSIDRVRYNAIYLKSKPSNYGLIDGVWFRDVEVTDRILSEALIAVRMDYKGDTSTSHPTDYENINIENVFCRNASDAHPAIAIVGNSASHIGRRDPVTLRNIHIGGAKPGYYELVTYTDGYVKANVHVGQALLPYGLHDPVLSLEKVHATGSAPRDSGVLLDFLPAAQRLASRVGTSAAGILTNWSWFYGGEVASGWTQAPQADGRFTLAHAAGTPGTAYTVWSSTTQDSSQDTLQIAVALPLAQLEANGNPGYQPFTLAEVSTPLWDPAQFDRVLVRADDPLLQLVNHHGPATSGLVTNTFLVGTGGSLTPQVEPVLPFHALDPADFAAPQLFSFLYPELDPNGDANLNGIPNFTEYAAGYDPTASGLPDLGPGVAADLVLAHPLRPDAPDVGTAYWYCTDLAPASWQALVAGDHYETEPSGPGTVRLSLRPDFRAAHPILFLRHDFFVTP
jgi:hypothetical protein